MKKVLLTALFLASSVQAGEFDFKDGGTLTIEVDQNLGSMVEFPYPVKVIPATKYFEISPVETEVADNGTPVNITILNVKPVSMNQVRELVPIILEGKRSIKVTFVSRDASDRHHKIVALRQPTFKLKGFLEKETFLMTQMLRDEEAEGFKKEAFRRKLDVEGYDQFDLYLVRKYEGTELNGYIFRLINKTEYEITINPTAINFAEPNRAALLQMDSETLVPCKTKDPAYKPTGPCASTIRIVIRGESFGKFGAKSDLPFFLKPTER
jgi:hypothetical protein